MISFHCLVYENIEYLRNGHHQQQQQQQQQPPAPAAPPVAPVQHTTEKTTTITTTTTTAKDTTEKPYLDYLNDYVVDWKEPINLEPIKSPRFSNVGRLSPRLRPYVFPYDIRNHNYL